MTDAPPRPRSPAKGRTDTADVPPHNPELEQTIARVALLHPEKVAFLVDRGLTGSLLYRPALASIVDAVIAAHVAGETLDPLTIRQAMPDLDERVLVDLIAPERDVVAADGNIERWMRDAKELAAKRQLLGLMAEARQRVRDGLPVAAAVDALREAPALIPTLNVDDDPDLDEFLASDRPPYDWLVPNVLERGDRVIFTGNEGTGKSTLLRQLGAQASSGVHPFTLQPMPALSVLLVDCENSEDQARRALGPLRESAGDRYQPGRFRVRVLGHSTDLARPEVAADIAARIERYQVDLLIIGPLYKLIDDDPLKEVPARQVADTLDRLRQLRGTALILEAHSPYAEGAKAKRPQRPYGASLWSRWPEFGMYLAPDGQLQHWRGQRDERDWPRKLVRGGAWPWTVDADVAQGETWHGPTRCIEAVIATLAEVPGEELSTNQLAKAMRERGRAFRNEVVSEAASQAADDGLISRRNGPRAALLYRHLGDDQQTIPEAF